MEIWCLRIIPETPSFRDNSSKLSPAIIPLTDRLPESRKPRVSGILAGNSHCEHTFHMLYSLQLDAA